MVINLPTIHQNTDKDGLLRTYREQRRAYYNQFPEFWGTFPEETPEEYAVYGTFEVSRDQAQELRRATSCLYHLMTRLASSLQQADDQSLIDIGIPLPALPYVRTAIPEMPAVMCGRFEFALTAEGPKLLEFNAETPTFVVELFHINGQVCSDFGLVDPNRHCQQQLALAVRAAIDAGLSWVKLHQGTPALIIFSAYAKCKEERVTTEFYRSLLSSKDNLPYRTSFCDLGDLRVGSDGLFTTSGERIDVLYKLYPTEHLINDKASDGTPVGLLLMELVRKQHLAVINPPISFLLQNKALMAILWAMHLEQSELFTSEEHAWIDQYVLPTYLTPYDAHGQPVFTVQHVVKPIYGREGTSITIHNTSGVVEQNKKNNYNNQVMIYQDYATLPTTTIQTENGPTKVNLVHNCFVVGGTPSAIGIRACQRLILDNNSYFLPTCLPQESR
jgi:glutathionylspermidine synthase